MILIGTGPANGLYTLLTSPNVLLPPAQWASAGNGTFDGTGAFSITNTPAAGGGQQFYLLQIP